MLLARYAGRAFEGTDLDRHARRAAQAHEVLIRSSKFCPHCLRERRRLAAALAARVERDLHAHGVLLAALPRVRDRAEGCFAQPLDQRPPAGGCSDPTRCTRRLGRELCRTHLASVVGARRRRRGRQGAAPDRRAAGGRLVPGARGRAARPPALSSAACRCSASSCRPRHSRIASSPAATTSRASASRSIQPSSRLCWPAVLGLAEIPDRSALPTPRAGSPRTATTQDGSTLPVGQLGDCQTTMRDSAPA